MTRRPFDGDGKHHRVPHDDSFGSPSYLLYGVYVLFVILAFTHFGPRIEGTPTQNTGTPALFRAAIVASMRLM